MWETPIYRFERKRIGTNGKTTKQLITIDVTDSAPTMDGPGIYLEGVFDSLLKGKKPRDTNILDFGAGKMRNTLFLLEQGYQIYSAEFPELPGRKPQAKTCWDRLEEYPNFKKLIFPRDFYKLKKEMDVVLLINVLNVMPVPEERLVALALCRRRMKEGGLLFLLNWRPASSDPNKYNDQSTLNDGWFCGKGHKVKTFHVEWPKEEIMEMMAATGYSPCSTVEIEKTSGSQSYVFAADGPVILDNALAISEAEKGNPKYGPEMISQELQRPIILQEYLNELKTISSGKEESNRYKYLAMRMIAGIFENELKNPYAEASIDQGRGFIDIRFQNRNELGFLALVRN